MLVQFEPAISKIYFHVCEIHGAKINHTLNVNPVVLGLATVSPLQIVDVMDEHVIDVVGFIVIWNSVVDMIFDWQRSTREIVFSMRLNISPIIVVVVWVRGGSAGVFLRILVARRNWMG